MKDIISLLKFKVSYKLDNNVIKTVKKDNKQIVIKKINNSKYCYNVFVFENDLLYMDYEALTITEVEKVIKSFT